MAMTFSKCNLYQHYPTLILVRGLPGSGKSTFARKHACGHEKRIVVEADMWFVDANGDYRFDPKQIKAAHEWCQTVTRVFLHEGYDVFVANTFTQKWEVDQYVKIADEEDCWIKIYHVTGNFKNVHGVPEETIRRMDARWEAIQGEIVQLSLPYDPAEDARKAAKAA